MKDSTKYLILFILTIINIQFFYILLLLPFPFFGLITGFILSCIWVYLFLRFCIWSINKIFKKNISVKKIYLALPYPLIMLSWFGFSFVPLEWQPSFREFERLCSENDSQKIVYNTALKEKYSKSNVYPKEQANFKRINYRLIEKEVFWYDRDSDELFAKFYNYYWTDIGMIPHYEREMICPDIQKYRAIQEKRWWLK